MHKSFLIAFLMLLAPGARSARAEAWKPLGPPGGDVRSLAVDPTRSARIFLGTADGHIFGSQDSGGHWALLGRASARLDAVITAIVVDPRDGNVLFASSWTRDAAAEGGGIFRSGDGGHTWTSTGLAGKAVRALAMAHSDPNILIAGTLDGVYRSQDASNTWERISPEHHEELRNFDSLAIDPGDPQTIYAGTFHLPWKTTDGGRTWSPIHEGMIDDSDVMSLLVDGSNAGRIFASACSGIYRSDDAAAQWKKIQGIPYAARRTYAITQDPKDPATVYAATSEGLWKTADGGRTWRITTPPSWVVNAVVVSEGESGRVVIGTEELGVLSSDDGGDHFQDANKGFNHRQILALGLDANHSGRVLAVMANTLEPILATDDDGKTWSPLGPGLRAEQVLRVYAVSDGGWWASLAHGGLVRYDVQKNTWMRAGALIGPTGTRKMPGSRGAIASITARSKAGPRALGEVVADMAFTSKNWYAATAAGLLTSADQGATWKPMPVGPLTSVPVQSVSVSSNGERFRVVSQRGLVFSDDGGTSWSWHDLPLQSGGAVTLAADPTNQNTLIAIAHNGLYISRDAGDTWKQAGSGLPSTPVHDFAATGGVYVASMRTGGLYVSSDSGKNWSRIPGTLADGLFAAVASTNVPGVIFAASATEGLYTVEWTDSAVKRADSRDPSIKSIKQTARDEATPGNR